HVLQFHGLTTDKFDQCIAKAKAEGGELTQEAYLKLEEPSEAEPARFYKSYMKGLYDRIIGMCPRPDQMCVGEMAKIDALRERTSPKMAAETPDASA
uniref:COX aromatic rich motif-containing protein n=1 Tax=Methylobacterium sp. B34 TaxID=95563 RepID=UPI0005B2E0F8